MSERTSRNETVAIAGIGIAILVLAYFFHAGVGTGPTSTTTTLSYTNPNPGPLQLAANDQAIAYGIPSYKDNLQVQQADLSMLYSTGAGCIRTDIGYGPWLSGDTNTQSVIEQTVGGIQSSGHCLILADASSESYRGAGCLNWAQFQSAWVQRVTAFASLFHPIYYVVVKEPGWYVPMVCDAQTNPQFQSASSWLSLTQQLVTAVQQASPSTIVGVSVAADNVGSQQPFYYAYLNGVQPLVGFIAFDIYDQSGQTATTNYLAANLPSKPVWIAEAWSQPTPTTGAQSQSDAQWMKSIDLYAQQIGAKELIPFYTDLFAGYGGASSASFYQNGLTPVGQEFANCVAGRP